MLLPDGEAFIRRHILEEGTENVKTLLGQKDFSSG